MEERSLLLQVNNLKKYYPVIAGSTQRGRKLLKAVDGVSLEVHEGETVGLVGESGCGKSTLGKTILKLEKATEGEIIYDGAHIEAYNNRQMRPLRKDMQIIFQDPYASLNPRMSIFDSVEEPLNVQQMPESVDKVKRVMQILEYVGVASNDIYKYPHEMSGGQRQRVAIARSMITNPRFVVCDEPVSALDVSIRSQVLNLMKRIQRETGVAYLFISHDLSVVKYICETVMVMYLGTIIEKATSRDLFKNPMHPYTQALLSAIPIPDIHQRRIGVPAMGEMPSPVNPPSGCRFHNRCPYAMAACSEITPELQEASPEHFIACHRYDMASRDETISSSAYLERQIQKNAVTDIDAPN